VGYVKVEGKFRGVEGVYGCMGAGENCIMRGFTASDVH